MTLQHRCSLSDVFSASNSNDIVNVILYIVSELAFKVWRAWNACNGGVPDSWERCLSEVHMDQIEISQFLEGKCWRASIISVKNIFEAWL